MPTSGAACAEPTRPWVPSRYAGSLSDRHVAAVARTAMQARGFRPDLIALGDVVTAELVRRHELAESVLPERWPDLARAWRRSAAPVRDRLPAMVVLGERHARVLQAVAGAAGDPAADVALLGGLFNAAIATIDHVADAGDARLLAALTPDVLRSVLGDEEERGAALDGLRGRVGDDPSARTAVELVGAWAELAAGLRARSGNDRAWAVLRSTLRSLLEAQRTVSGLPVDASAHLDTVVTATRLKSEGPSIAIAQMVALARAVGDPPPGSLWLAAARLGRVFCLADDMADLVDDARAGRSNIHLLGARPKGGWLCDPAVYATIDAAAAELSAVVAPTGNEAVDGFTAEVVARWLRWDEHERRVSSAAEVGGADDLAARSALRLLLDHRAKGYGSSRHELTFPRGRIGAERPQTHSDVLFVRAVALDALLDAFDAGLPVDHSVLCEEGLRVLLAKHPTARGGWSYLASVPELPPDADDLAQVLHVLARLGGRPLAAACDEAVRLVLDAADDRGGFPTWIVDGRRGGALDVEMGRYVEVVGGGGVHAEVVANLLGALARADPARYRRVIASGAAYVAGAQQPDGSWASTWYAGPYYGTFRAAAVLAAMPAWSQQCARARDFLVERRQGNGGWGTGDSESISTAFAVLGLCALDPRTCIGAIAAGAARLRETQDRDGGWPAAPWIQFPTREGTVAYGSAAITTAFCLRALLAAGAVSARHSPGAVP